LKNRDLNLQPGRDLVEDRQWLSEAEYDDGLAIAAA
jgi:chromate transport protein ChrA